MDGIVLQPGMARQAAGGGWTPPAGLDQWHYGNNTEAGGEWTDQSGNGNHAALNGAASIGANGLTGGFSNSDFADVLTSVGASTYTLACWLYFPPAMAADMGAFGPTSGTNQIFWADITTGPVWKIASNSPARYGATNADYRGQWVHYAWVANGGDIEQFVNGVSDGLHTSTAPTGTLIATIGRAGSGKNLDNGYLDDAMIYPATALSGADIADIYNNSPGTHKP